MVELEIPPEDYIYPNWHDKHRIHDWKNHVSEELQDMWDDFNNSQKAAIARMCDAISNNEDWE